MNKAFHEWLESTRGKAIKEPVSLKPAPCMLTNRNPWGLMHEWNVKECVFLVSVMPLNRGSIQMTLQYAYSCVLSRQRREVLACDVFQPLQVHGVIQSDPVCFSPYSLFSEYHCHYLAWRKAVWRKWTHFPVSWGCRVGPVTVDLGFSSPIQWSLVYLSFQDYTLMLQDGLSG